ADQGTRQAIRRAARENPGARLIVTGCYASRSPAEIERLPGVALVVHNRDKDALPDIVAGLVPELGLTTRERFDPDGDGACGLRIGPGAAGRTAFTLRVQTGCEESCAYCIIPATRGPSLSRPIEWVLEQISRACDAGYREIILTGVHLGAYGRDLRPRRSLAELLDRVARLDRDVLFRIGSLEPMDCTPDVVDIIAERSRMAPAFHLPLQHASDRVLRAMRRPYHLEYYAALVDSIRRRLPLATIGSDIIVGFPQEDADDFAQLVSYLEDSPLTQLHVFPYSDRPGTAASRMYPKVDGVEVRRRSQAIRAIGQRLSARFREQLAGTIHRGLAIDDGSTAVLTNGVRVPLPERRTRNEWIEVRVVVESGALTGEIVSGRHAGISVAAR
ncbi:MAG TPA: MiaB/RimO family radical SAM methylthiotransferase, partial [Vicinamibacterales bacterium]|nr:MiaB/RimO family radical SAM methylthiotransferase [Vicinamibacterales bacterium]